MEEYEIRFGKRTQDFFELSPYHFSTFTIKGKKWRTLVHYWCASYFIANDYMKEMLRNTDTPEKALIIARKYGLKSFEQCAPKEILFSIQERFNQCDGVRSVLMCTGLTPLLYEGDEYLSGNNRYGKILMKVRELYADK